MTFESAEPFIRAFGIREAQNYYDIVVLKDRKVGFSVKRQYPENIGFKPTHRRSGEPNDVAVFWVTYLHPSETRQTIDPNRVPIAVRVATVNLYVSEHWDYDFDDENSPTLESIEASKASIKPLELEENEAYFYNHERNLIVDVAGNAISGSEILNRLFQQHCDTAHRWRGLKIRSKMTAREFVFRAFGWLSDFIKDVILKNVFGRTIEEDDTYSGFFKGYPISSLKKLSTDSLEIFGYKAPRGIIVLYCGLIIFFWCLTDEKESYLEKIADKELLFLAHTIFAVWALDFFGPLLLLVCANTLIRWRRKMFRMKFVV